MSHEETSYEDEEEEFDLASNDEEFDLDLDVKDLPTNLDGSPIAKRRVIEALLEERRLKKQLEDDFDFDEDDDF